MHDHGRPENGAQAAGPLRIAIIGGGASGTLTAVQLLRQAAAGGVPLHITLIDGHGRHGTGKAYSTTHRGHLLNAMAAQMSALPDDPDHLIRWTAAAGADGPLASRTTFLPRQDYGRYLRDTLATAERQARLASPPSELTRLSREVLAISRDEAGQPVRLILSDGHLDADLAVLATGNEPGRLPFPAPDSDQIIADPWLPGALSGVLGDQPDDRGSDDVVVIGTGLTMLDLAVAIADARPGARVHAVSRHGLLPRSHPGTEPRSQPMWLPVITRTTGPVRLAELMWQVRSAIAASPASWQPVMESLRPITPGLWRRMSDRDKRLFLRHVARYWEVHRHLVPPATASRITALRCTGQLLVHQGRIRAVRQHDARLSVLVDNGTDTVELEAGWLINGTGAPADISATVSPLLRSLFGSGLARPDSLGLGIDATVHGSVLDAAGRPSDVLYTLGPPLRGLWYETTAIPEIRAQAAGLAARVTAGLSARQRPGSAA